MDKSSSNQPTSMRWFPWKLYAYVLGAALMGWGVGAGMAAPDSSSLAALLFGCFLCVIGFVTMRPYMRAAHESAVAPVSSNAESDK